MIGVLMSLVVEVKWLERKSSQLFLTFLKIGKVNRTKPY